MLSKFTSKFTSKGVRDAVSSGVRSTLYKTVQSIPKVVRLTKSLIKPEEVALYLRVSKIDLVRVPFSTSKNNMHDTWPFKPVMTHVSCYSNGYPLVFNPYANMFGYRKTVKTTQCAPWYINFDNFDIHNTPYAPYGLYVNPIKILDNSNDPRINAYVLHYKTDVGAEIEGNFERYDPKKHRFLY